MAHRLAWGYEVHRFYLNHDYVTIQDDGGQPFITKREDVDKLGNVFDIPCMVDRIMPSLLRTLLARGGFAEKQFWKEIDPHGSQD